LSMAARMDAARGDLSRSAWLRQIIIGELTTPQEREDWEARALAAEETIRQARALLGDVFATRMVRQEPPPPPPPQVDESVITYIEQGERQG